MTYLARGLPERKLKLALKLQYEYVHAYGRTSGVRAVQTI